MEPGGALLVATLAAIAIATAITATTTAKATTATTAAAAEATTAAAATTAEAARAFFLGASFVNRQLTAIEFGAINFLGCALRFFCCAHGYECETTGTTGHAVHSDIDVGDAAILAEMRTEFVFGCFE
jgi:hypothetical protein